MRQLATKPQYDLVTRNDGPNWNKSNFFSILEKENTNKEKKHYLYNFKIRSF